MITLLHYMDGINGSLVSIIDYYNGLKNMGFETNLVLLSDKSILDKSIMSLCSSYNLKKYLSSIKLTKTIKSDIIICSSALFFKGIDVKLNYNKIFVLDSLELTKMKHGFISPVNIPENGVYLCNPCNMLDGYNCFEYYHKIDFFRNTEFNEEFVYKRSGKDGIKVGGNMYIENIGKTIFEYLRHGRKVRYFTDGKFMDDGLTYYLKLLGIDDNKNQVLENTDVSCLSFNKNDLLVGML